MANWHDKSKRFERDIGEMLLEYDGECPKWKNLTTSKARTGQLSDLQMDILSKTYSAEAKHISDFPKWLFGGMKEVIKESGNKESLMIIEHEDRDIVMHCITRDRHIALLEKDEDKNFEDLSEIYHIKKDIRSTPKWLFNSFKQIVDVSNTHNKEALFALKKDSRVYPEIHILTPERHKNLL